MLCEIGCAFCIGITRIKLKRRINQMVGQSKELAWLTLRKQLHKIYAMTRIFQHERRWNNNAPLPKLNRVGPGTAIMGVVTTCHNGGSTAHNAIS